MEIVTGMAQDSLHFFWRIEANYLSSNRFMVKLILPGD